MKTQRSEPPRSSHLAANHLDFFMLSTQEALLNTIDNLRSHGVGELVNLPQIIVVGDQLSGKSSVLETISRVRFPVKGGVCTRFATELVLRKAPQVEIVVKIRARDSDSGHQSVAFEEKCFQREGLLQLIEAAKKAMGIRDGGTSYSEETLRVEISAPDLSSLTLVDLPGIHHTKTEDQSEEGIAVVSRIVQRYMKQKNSIILAIVSAKNEVAQQKILKITRQHDPNGERTMGIITKPDSLVPGWSDERMYIKLATNQEGANKLSLGWHVLRDRDSQENGEEHEGAPRTSDDDRDRQENEFFLAGAWSDLPAQIKGVATLRRKLSQVLTKHIHLSLPGVMDDIKTNLDAREERLLRLGTTRETDADRQFYLIDIFGRFRDLTQAAVKGTYDGIFFADAPQDGSCAAQAQSNPRKLRAVVRNLSHAFDATISSRGLTQKIVSDDDTIDPDDETNGHDVPGSLQAWIELYKVDPPETVLLSEVKAVLEVKASHNQGHQFPASPNDRLALELFRGLSRRWKDIAAKYLKLVIDSAQSFVELALTHVTGSDQTTRNSILLECVEPFFENRAKKLDKKMEELLQHYYNGDIICLEDDFRKRLTARTKRRRASRIRDILKSECPEPVTTNQKGQPKDINIQAVVDALDDHVIDFGSERVVDMAMVYYEMSLRTFTDNVIILAAENCLVSKLPSLLTSSKVQEMDTDMIEMLAAESAEIRLERADLERDIKVLKDGYRICKKERPRQPTACPSTAVTATASSLAKSRSPTPITGTTQIAFNFKPRAPGFSPFAQSSNPTSASGAGTSFLVGAKDMPVATSTLFNASTLGSGFSGSSVSGSVQGFGPGNVSGSSGSTLAAAALSARTEQRRQGPIFTSTSNGV